ncbi:MAG: multicopper oxidase family protein, partial [Candidatus Saccharimonadales bacterium]
MSDVYYDRFLSNGERVQRAPAFKAGDTVRLRIVNGSSSTYFWLNYAGGKITVVASDGEDVQPVKVDRMIIAAAETYDILVTIPKDGSYELLATVEDRSKSTSLWLGSGAEVSAKPLPKLNYFKGMQMMDRIMGTDGNLQRMEGMQMGNQMMDMNSVMYPELDGVAATPATLNYGMLKAVKPTNLPPGPVRVLRFNLTGNMNRYVWTINNKTVSEADKILIKKGENVRIILYNNTMMRHPMHLHGHFFRVLNGQGNYAPLKNTMDIMPMETDTIEFAATASGDWFFHCHILYHMMSGMGRIFSYEGSPKNPELPDPAAAIKKVYADDRRFFASARAALESNGSDGNLDFANTRWEVQTLWRLGLNDAKGYESETIAGRYFGQMQWLYAYTGFDYEYRKVSGPENNLFGQVSDKNNRKTIVAGIAYTLPMLV